MNKPPSPPGWPAWLLFVFIIVGPPSAIVAFFPTVTRNPLVAGGLLLTYEVLGISIQAVIKKNWERRRNAWVDAGASPLERVLRLFFASAGRRYCEFFCYEHRDLDMKGISTRGTYLLDLEQIFVEVCIDPLPGQKASSDSIHLPSALSTDTHDIWDYLVYLDQHLVILGAPGSGKTTLLKHLGLCLIQDRRRRKARARQLPWTVPIFLPLREHSAQLKDQPDYDLVEATNLQIRQWRQAIPPKWIERQLQKGRCLVLLDGLDEIADSAQHQQMVTWVQSQMLAYPKNRFLITSRPLGYRAHPLDGVTVLDVLPLTFEQITRFLHAWYLANEIKRAGRDDPGVRMRADAGAEDLLQRLHTTPALFAMAANPLLLIMIATVHLYYGQLPGARITLYKAICEVFLSRRTEVSGGSKELRADQRQLVLQPLAYTLMQQGKREISREEVCPILEKPLQLVDTTLTPQSFLDHLEAISSGLLLEREQGIYSFAHQTFQEYLAMIHIQENHLERELLNHIQESWWHETILLFCAQNDATAILEACINQPLPSREAMTLAMGCVEDARAVKAEVKERFYALLEQEVNDADSARRQVIAEALLNRRLRQMRPLQEGLFVATSLVTCVEYQLFLDEQRLHGPNSVPDTWNEQTFPQGQGRKSVLGVRKEDAEAFCRWLTERDRDEQCYRLPKQEERQQIKMSVDAEFPEDTSYWEDDGSLVWSHDGPSMALQKQVFTSITSSFTPSRISNLSSISEGALTCDRTCIQDLALALPSTLNRIYIGALDLSRASTLARNLASTLDHPSAIDLARDLVSTLGIALTHASDIIRDHDRYRADANERYPSDDSGFAIGLAYEQDYEYSNRRTLSSAFVDAFRMYSALSFLQRPKGIPPYEGILLIKERTTETRPAPRN